jgi:CRP-like cAMP-binding protein
MIESITGEMQVVKNEETGKFRVLVTIFKGDFMDVKFILSAEEAESWGVKLVEASRTARGKNIIIPFQS